MTTAGTLDLNFNDKNGQEFIDEETPVCGLGIAWEKTLGSPSACGTT